MRNVVAADAVPESIMSPAGSAVLPAKVSDPIEPADLLVHAHRDRHPVEIAAQFLASRLIHVTGNESLVKKGLKAVERVGARVGRGVADLTGNPADAGRVRRLLGVTTKTRVAALADIPTIDEAGVPGYESYTWFGLFGPKDLDPKITARINTAVRTILEMPSLRQKFLETGLAPRVETVEQFRATVKANRAKWAEVVKASGAHVDK